MKKAIWIECDKVFDEEIIKREWKRLDVKVTEAETLNREAVLEIAKGKCISDASAEALADNICELVVDKPINTQDKEEDLIAFAEVKIENLQARVKELEEEVTVKTNLTCDALDGNRKLRTKLDIAVKALKKIDEAHGLYYFHELRGIAWSAIYEIEAYSKMERTTEDKVKIPRGMLDMTSTGDLPEPEAKPKRKRIEPLDDGLAGKFTLLPYVGVLHCKINELIEAHNEEAE